MHFYQYPFSLNDETINKWPFWLFEENIKLTNQQNAENTTTVNLADPNLKGPLDKMF